MKKYSDLEYLRLAKGQKFLYKFVSFFAAIPQAIGNIFLGIGRFFQTLGAGIGREFSEIFSTFAKGDWKTKLSFLIMGFGSLARGQVLRGLMFLLFEIVFLFYMITSGGYWLSMLPSLGKLGPHMEYDAVLDTHYPVYGDNSFKIMLYGVLTVFFIIAFIYTWRLKSWWPSPTTTARTTATPTRCARGWVWRISAPCFPGTSAASTMPRPLARC